MAVTVSKICEPLCYLYNMYGKMNEKELVSVLLDYYSHAKITEAKEVLLDDVEALNLENWIRPKNRRDTDYISRTAKEIGDIMATWTFLDEGKLIDSMPKYTIHCLKNIPSIRMEAGDCKLIWNKMEKQNEVINGNFEQLQSQVHITSDIASTMKNIFVQVNNIQKELAVNQKHLIETRNLMNGALNLGHRELQSKSRDWHTMCLQSDQRSDDKEDNNTNEENENLFDLPENSQYNTEPKIVDDFDVENDDFETVQKKRNVIKKRKIDERSPVNTSTLYSQRVASGLQALGMSQPGKQQGGVFKKTTYVGSSKKSRISNKGSAVIVEEGFLLSG